MATIDYEKKYKEALATARKLYNMRGDWTNLEIESIFPELRGSEDERIRKELLDFCKNRAEKYPNDPKYKNISAWIAWLEKQGKNNMGISEATKQELEDNLNKALEKETPESCNEFLEKQCEQKPTPKFRVGDKIWHKNYKGECMHHIIRIENNNYIGDDNTSISISTADKEYELVEKLCKKNSAWSEEDERIYQSIMDDTVEENQLNDKQTNWLRDIKYRYFPQPKQEWKPSDEQMVAIQEAMNIVGVLTITGSKINSLYQDLKKLKR